MMPRAIQVVGLDHVALTVSDVRRSADWYRELLGLEQVHADVWGDEPAMMVAREGGSGLALFAASTSTPAATPDRRRTLVVRHVAFRVSRESFERAQRDLTERAIEWERAHHTVAESIYFHDPDGHEIELTTYEGV